MLKASTWFQIWQKRNWINWALLPLTLLARVWWWFRCVTIHPTPMPVVVIVVGNLWPGGTGKTPVVMALVQKLQQNRLTVAVASRGQGRTRSAPMLLNDQTQAHQSGDEPLLIHRKTGVPVAVATSRIAAIELLLTHHPETQVVVCDDGLQHLPLAHDIALLILDERGLGNGWMLPAGPLREPWPRPARAQLHEWVLSTDVSKPHHWPILRQLSEEAINGLGQRLPLAELTQCPLAAVCGIAKPDHFFTALQQAQLQIAHKEAWPDHWAFEGWVPREFAQDRWVCTEKDAVKLWPRYPKIWAIPLECKLPDALWPALHDAIDTRLRFLHGHQIT